MNLGLISIFTLFLNLCFLSSFGQQEKSGMAGQKNAIALFRKSVEGNSSLYRGEIYAGLSKVIRGHPFYLSKNWHKGTVKFQGNLYHEVPILYDIYQDEIVVLHYNGFLKVQLLQSEVSYLSFSDHSFYLLNQAKFSGFPFQAGLYEALYEGEHTIYVKRKKIVEEWIKEMVVKREFAEADVFIIEREGTFYMVKGRGSVLNILKDRKKIVRKGMRKNKIKFRRDPEHAIVKMVEFYENVAQ